MTQPNRTGGQVGQTLIAPSLLAADFANLQRDLSVINQSEADYLHFDVMDGEFVPNISFGFPVLEAAHKHCQKPLDVHLMIVQPDRYIDAFAEGGAAIIHVHFEACTHLHRSLSRIRERGCRAGVALNPHTPVEGLIDVLDLIDVVLIMSVNPGFGGQAFIPHTLQKVSRLKQLLIANQAPALIEIDGGVGLSNAAVLVQAGADILVAGNSVFRADDPATAIHQLKNSYQPTMA